MKEANGKMEFFYQYKEGDGSIAMTLPPDATLEEALEGFETFLRAAGYVFDGQIDIIDSCIVDPNAEAN